MNPVKGSSKSTNEKKFFIENIARFCDKCGKAYTPDNVEILQQNDYSVIIHFSCDNCKARHLATFIRPLGITSRMPVNTDLSMEELAEYSQYDSISSNDVLDIHELLKDSEFSFKDLIKKF